MARNGRLGISGVVRMTLSLLGVVVLVGVAALYLLVRIVDTVRQWHEPTTHWVRRSPVNRRQRQTPVAVERRKGPRRQEEIAGAFLAGLTPRRGRLKVVSRG
jgi:hypothetical protein